MKECLIDNEISEPISAETLKSLQKKLDQKLPPERTWFTLEESRAYGLKKIEEWFAARGGKGPTPEESRAYYLKLLNE